MSIFTYALFQMRRFRAGARRNKAEDEFMEQSHLTHPPGSDSETPQQNLPIHERQLQVDPQKNSPLYDGTIPAEIRYQIFFYSLQEFLKTDYDSIWLDKRIYTRPGYTADRKVDISLLLTCRKVYLEIYHLPVLAKEHYFFHGVGAGPPYPFPHSRYHEAELDYFAKFQPWQLSLVKEVHLFTQMKWLELTFPAYCKQYFMRGIEKLKITIRRSDWWWYKTNGPLTINPYRGMSQFQSSIEQMHQDIAAQARGDVPLFPNNVWSSAFKNLSSLKELEIEFETSDDKKDELDTILKWAKTWKFPLGDGRVLSTEGLAVTSSFWQEGPFRFWSDQCPYCPNPEKCEGRAPSRFHELGPKCYIYSMRWRVAPDTNTPNAD